MDGKPRARYSREVKLTNKRVLIIGGSSGIGLATAQAAHREGAETIIAARTSASLEAARTTFDTSDRVKAHTVDVTKEENVAQLFRSIGELDHIVVTAAEGVYRLLSECSVDDMLRVIHSKLLGAMLVGKYGGPRLRAGGSLTFTSGIAAERPLPRGSLIASVNGGLNSLARALALELAPVRVNAISPGWVDTPIWQRAIGPNSSAMQAQMAARLPVRRIGRGEDLAEAILFLMTNEFTTGSVLHVDGGHPLV